MSKYYVFPIGMVDVEIVTKEKFDEIIKKGKEKGHTHVQIKCVGYCDRFLPIESDTLDKIANNYDIEGYGVYAIRTGYPFYSNSSRFRPYVSGVTEKPNSSYEAGLASFINN